MLTNFVFCIPLKSKSASEIVTAWRNHIAFPFGVSRKLLTDNGTEFKNSLFAEVAKELGLERKIYSPPYRPQLNGVLEGFHKFLKASFAKHISSTKNGTMWQQWQQRHITICQINIQKKPHFL